MARLKSPLMSMTAQKQLGKTLIYKMKDHKAFVTGYGRPGKKNPFTPSASQIENRDFRGEMIGEWQEKTQEEKDYWNDLAKARNLNMSGWNLFYQTAYNDPLRILGDSIYGIRIYGYYEYGKQQPA